MYIEFTFYLPDVLFYLYKSQRGQQVSHGQPGELMSHDPRTVLSFQTFDRNGSIQSVSSLNK